MHKAFHITIQDRNQEKNVTSILHHMLHEKLSKCHASWYTEYILQKMCTENIKNLKWGKNKNHTTHR